MHNPETLRKPDGSVNPESKAFIAFERQENPDVNLDDLIQKGAPAEGVRVIVADIGGYTEDTNRLTNKWRHLTGMVLAPDVLGAVMVEYERPTKIEKRGSAVPGKLTKDQRKSIPGGEIEASSSAEGAVGALKKIMGGRS